MGQCTLRFISLTHEHFFLAGLACPGTPSLLLSIFYLFREGVRILQLFQRECSEFDIATVKRDRLSVSGWGTRETVVIHMVGSSAGATTCLGSGQPSARHFPPGAAAMSSILASLKTTAVDFVEDSVLPRSFALLARAPSSFDSVIRYFIRQNLGDRLHKLKVRDWQCLFVFRPPAIARISFFLQT